MWRNSRHKTTFLFSQESLLLSEEEDGEYFPFMKNGSELIEDVSPVSFSESEVQLRQSCRDEEEEVAVHANLHIINN